MEVKVQGHYVRKGNKTFFRRAYTREQKRANRLVGLEAMMKTKKSQNAYQKALNNPENEDRYGLNIKREIARDYDTTNYRNSGKGASWGDARKLRKKRTAAAFKDKMALYSGKKYHSYGVSHKPRTNRAAENVKTGADLKYQKAIEKARKAPNGVSKASIISRALGMEGRISSGVRRNRNK